MTNEEINEIVNDWYISAEKLKDCSHSKIVDSLTLSAAEDVIQLSREIKRLKKHLTMSEITTFEDLKNTETTSVLGNK